MYDIPLKASGAAIDIALEINLFHHAVSPTVHTGDIAARGWGQEVNGQSLIGHSTKQREDRAVAATLLSNITFGIVHTDQHRGINPILFRNDS